MTTCQVYYPEKGGKADSGKLFTFVDWKPEDDERARSVFKRLGVRPEVSRTDLRSGGHKFTARLTSRAWDLVQAEGDVSIEALL
jgi:hypothetical protein